jgi:hypothetical protein
VWRHDDDVARPDVELLLVRNDRRLAFERDEDLLVGVPVQARSSTRRRVDEDDADAG